MCGIISSFSGDKIRELYEKNARRGTGAITLTLLNPSGVVGIWRNQYDNSLDQFNRKLDDDEYYKIIHVQSPTSTDRTKTHPSDLRGSLLWHNGILKESTISVLQSSLNTSEKWDTHLLHRGYIDADSHEEFLSSLDGSFACLYHSGFYLYAFRNTIAPLFYDDEMTFSSVRFDQSKPVPPNKTFLVNLVDRSMFDTSIDFKTKNDPYGV